MRPTVREQFAELITDSLAKIREIRKEFEQLGDLNQAQSQLVEWQDVTALRLERFLGTNEARQFREEVNLNPVGLSGQMVIGWLTKYEGMLAFFLKTASTSNIKYGYAEDVRVPLERIDELVDHLSDLWTRSGVDSQPNYQTAQDGLRRWKERAYAVLVDVVGAEEAGQIYEKEPSMTPIEGGLKGLFSTYFQFLFDLKEEIQKYPHHLASSSSVPRTMESTKVNNKKVFIAHGHGYLKDAVARVIEKLKLDPIILEEKPSSGHTIIGKFEKYADVGYAVVLLTPDDVGGLAGGEMLDRARQNVIFELGYFVGKIGLGHVCLLFDGVELPSDLLGVVYVRFDSTGAWKLHLAKELDAAGYDIDLNRLK